MENSSSNPFFTSVFFHFLEMLPLSSFNQLRNFFCWQIQIIFSCFSLIFMFFSLHIQSKLFLIFQKLFSVETEIFAFCWFEFQSLIQSNVSESIDDSEVCCELILNITSLLLKSSYNFDHTQNIR